MAKLELLKKIREIEELREENMKKLIILRNAYNQLDEPELKSIFQTPMGELVDKIDALDNRLERLYYIKNEIFPDRF